MRLLNEHMPVPEMHPSAYSEIASSRTQTQPKPKADAKETVSTESRNLHLARQVQEHKSKLIHELAKLPLTALWLTKRYDQNSGDFDNEDETSLNSDIYESIKVVKSNLDGLIAKTSSPDFSRQDHSSHSRLISSVEQFPFAFDDLVVMVDLTIDVARQLSCQLTADANLPKHEADAVEKRLSGKLNWLAKQNVQNLYSLNPADYDLHFLLAGTTDLSERLSSIVVAEKHWLASRQLLATANSKLVLFIANQYKGNFLDFEDLVQEGNTGLLKAVDRFKHQLGFQFSTYAGYWIRQAISRSLSRSERVVRIPCGQIAIINKIFRVKDELTLKFGKEPDNSHLAESTGLSLAEINNILSISQTSVPLESFDEDEDESFAPIDFLEQKVFTHCSENIAKKQLERLVDRAIKTLNPREARIVKSHFGVGTDQQSTLQEIGSELNLTRERVRQIQVVALNKIKNRYGEQLFSFL